LAGYDIIMGRNSSHLGEEEVRSKQ